MLFRRSIISAIVLVIAFLLVVLTSLIRYDAHNLSVRQDLLKEVTLRHLSNLTVPEARLSKIHHGLHHNKTHALRKRALSWEDAKSAGQTLLDKLDGPRQDSRSSTVKQLEDNGWTIEPKTREKRTADYDEPDGPYSKLSIKLEDGWFIKAKQDKEYSNCRHKNNVATGGYFISTYNVPGRTIIGLDNYSPAYYRKMMDLSEEDDVVLAPVRERLPEVSKWSDVVWTLWADQAGDQAGTLKYIFKHIVLTPETMTIMDVAASRSSDDGSNDSDELTAVWPGYTFKKGSEEFQALLGTPHGKGVVNLLVGHADQMPEKDIESITIFSYAGDSYHLLFTLTGDGNSSA